MAYSPTLYRLALGALLVGSLLAQAEDQTYAEKIKEYTTDPRFISELVDHLPDSETVPSPRDHFGTIIGAPGILHYSNEIYAYFRALEKVSRRILVRSIGKTEEDREMIEVIVADAGTIENLETYRTHLNRLADPRTLTAEEAEEIITSAKPIYYVTAGLHSPETGPPEMLMELVYRLAVDESPLVQTIRENVIFICVPVTEPDGRDRMVDVYNYRKDHNEVGPPLLYWGHYVAHDNNRDGYGLALALTRNILSSFLYWKPIIGHDLHESIPYLYVSTGTGPYNEYVDPITIDEWHNLAHEEVTELTKRGMVGVWTHGFYTGWAANYLLWIPNLRNAIGRFYETFGNSIADTRERKLEKRWISRQWYRPNPPLEKTQWSLRNNTNYMQSGLLVALKYTADHREGLVENFYIKSRNAVQRGQDEPPHAWVIPAGQERSRAATQLIGLLLEEGLEVHRAQERLRWTSKIPADSPGRKEGTDERPQELFAPENSYVIRLDQPYRTLAQVLLDEQHFPEEAEPPYDDTGWTLPYLWNVEAYKVDDPAILEARMAPLTEAPRSPGGIEGAGRNYYLVNNTTEENLAVFRFRLEDLRLLASEEAFTIGRRSYNAGSLIVPVEDNPANLAERVAQVAAELDLPVRAVTRLPDIPTHEVEFPRVALVHTWVVIPQNAGWWRLAFDRIGIPYSYISEQDLATTDLTVFDVIIMPHNWARPRQLLTGNTEAGPAIPWKRTPTYRHIGVIDETDDVRAGMGYLGLAKLKEFIESGGVFITEGSSAGFPIDLGLTRRISIEKTSKLQARGTILQAVVADSTSPIIYGYDSLAVYFNQSPVFKVNKKLDDWRLPDWLKDEIWEKEVPRVVMRFAEQDLLLSGMLRGEQEIAGTPAVVDVPVGEGHVVLFGPRPFWRWQTHGSHALILNTILHWNDLRTGWPERPEEPGL